MILLLDNYDSFVHNLARYVVELGGEATVVRNDAITVEAVRQLNPSHIILSPGPCTPAEAGICSDVVLRLGSRIPMLGVCLGHQCIGAAYGTRVVRALRPMHGKTAPVFHEGTSVMRGLPNAFQAARYHSLVLDEASCPPELEITARSEEGEIMAVAHRDYPVAGVQFHPESVASQWGYHILANFLEMNPVNVLANSADLGRSSHE